MKVLVDTSIWSVAFRRKALSENESAILNELRRLVADLQVVMIGPIRQELLSGISDPEKYERLKEALTAFSDESIETADYELAAKFSNDCRRKGVQGSHVDFLICSVAFKNVWKIFTSDQDFLRYQQYLPLELYSIGE